MSKVTNEQKLARASTEYLMPLDSDEIEAIAHSAIIASFGDADSEEALEFIKDMAEENEWEDDWV